MDNKTDKDAFEEALLQERDELYQELSKLRQADSGALERAEKKNARYEMRRLLKTRMRRSGN